MVSKYSKKKHLRKKNSKVKTKKNLKGGKPSLFTRFRSGLSAGIIGTVGATADYKSGKKSLKEQSARKELFKLLYKNLRKKNYFKHLVSYLKDNETYLSESCSIDRHRLFKEIVEYLLNKDTGKILLDHSYFGDTPHPEANDITRNVILKNLELEKQTFINNVLAIDYPTPSPINYQQQRPGSYRNPAQQQTPVPYGYTAQQQRPGSYRNPYQQQRPGANPSRQPTNWSGYDRGGYGVARGGFKKIRKRKRKSKNKNKSKRKL